MTVRERDGSRWRGNRLTGAGPKRRRGRARSCVVEGLEARQLLTAGLDPIPTTEVPADLGRVLPLTGGTAAQTFSVESNNPDVGAQIVQGQFLTIDVTHASSGPGDPAFSGSMTFQLFQELTPITVNRILALVNQGFYTSPTDPPTNLPTKNFHRVASGFPGPEFIVQGGSKNGDGTGEIDQPGFPFQDEFRPQLVFTGEGQLAMANAGDDTNGSQFFITTGQPNFLDFQHTIFGQLVDGFETLDLMTQVSRNANDAPISPILITDTRTEALRPEGVLVINTTAANAGETAEIRVTATDPADGSTAEQTFIVDVVANTGDQRPFLGPIGDQITRPNEAAVFQLSATSTNPGEELTFAVGGGVAPDGTFAPVENATATVDSTGLVTVTPDPGFEGEIPLLVGVRDQTNRDPSGNLDAVGNFDTAAITLTVTTENQPTAVPIEVTTEENEPVTIQLAGDPNNPGQSLLFELTSVPVLGELTDFDPEAGTVVYTPFTNKVGADAFTFRVQSVGEPTPNTFSEEAIVSIEIEPGEPEPVPPTALPLDITVQVNTSVPVQLQGESNNGDQSRNLTFAIDTSETQGTVTGFDPETGSFTYEPPRNFVGTDTLTYTVTDTLVSGESLESETVTVTFDVIGAVDTGAVRRIGAVLFVTPRPPGSLEFARSQFNFIEVSVVDGRVVTSINGQIDEFQPPVNELELLVVYGSKGNDDVRIAPDLPLLTTLDGGLGGLNTLRSNDLPSRLHGWFGQNFLQGGASRDELIGRMGRVHFLPSGGDDLLFAGDPNRFPQLGDNPDNGQGEPPSGQFFRFVRGRLVPIPTPPPRAEGKFVFNPPPPRLPFPDLGAGLPDLGATADDGDSENRPSRGFQAHRERIERLRIQAQQFLKRLGQR